MNPENLKESCLDQEMAKRLAGLRDMPMDKSTLAHEISARISRFPSGDSKKRTFWNWWSRPLPAVAASIAIFLITSAALFYGISRTATASAFQIVQFHDDLVSGRVPSAKVHSIAEANRLLSSESPGTPLLPDMPNGHAMACCMRTIHNKKMACVLLEGDHEPVTLTVVNAVDMVMPSSPSTLRGDRTYHMQAVGSLNMVTFQRNGKWICLIAKLPGERLITIAEEIHF